MITASCIYSKDWNNLFPAFETPREKYHLALNETSSLTDLVFSSIREKKNPSSEELQILRSPTRLITESKEKIEDHIDKRIALFFQQLIVTYRVPFHFEIGKTQHQAPSTPTLSKVPFNSAHSATIPCLYAYHLDDWKKWEADPQNTPKPAPFVYLKGSDTYNHHNATIGLIKLVNTADIILDGTSQSADKLRIKSIGIIERSARGEIDPREGLKKFLTQAKKILIRQIISPDEKEEYRQILNIYLSRVENAIEQSKDESFFDQLINVKIDHESREASALRTLIYRSRFHIIRESQEMQSVIAKKIHDVAASIIGIGRKPANFDFVMKKKILSLSSSQGKKQLSRYFGVSLEQITHDLQGKRFAAAERKINEEEHKQKFDTLMRDIRTLCRDLVRREMAYRAQVTKDLRNHKRWRQKDLVAEYRKVYADGPMSQPTVSRLENTIKPIERQLAHRLASIFNVDPGFFFPAIFTSVE